MSVRSEVLLWAQRVLARKTALAHQLLEIGPDAGLDDVQLAFHKIARMAHPDLHRSSLTAEELELVTSAYSRIAGAYQEFRSNRMQAPRVKRDTTRPPVSRPEPRVTNPPASTPAPGAAGTMTSKALVYYRKAELALRRGDLHGAVLQLKMAIAADPLSSFLRTALTEVETEVGKKS